MWFTIYNDKKLNADQAEWAGRSRSVNQFAFLKSMFLSAVIRFIRSIRVQKG